MIALGGNLGGISSFLLSLQPETARSLRLDALFPLDGCLRHVDAGFELLAPSSWLADQTLARRKAQAVQALDLPALREIRPLAPRRVVPEPVVGFGPPGGNGETNMSVLVEDANAFGVRFQLSSLGTPVEVATRLLSTVVAPPGSGREATLLAATERRRGGYLIEFSVSSAMWSRHFLTVLCDDVDGQLYTLTIQVADREWADATLAATLRRCADAFAVTYPT